MTPKEQLLEAAEFFEKNPGRWIQAWSAIDKDGKEVGFFEKEAYNFCVFGYLYGKQHSYNFCTALDQAIGDESFSITSWNDEPGRTVEEVVELLRKAAKLCE